MFTIHTHYRDIDGNRMIETDTTQTFNDARLIVDDQYKRDDVIYCNVVHPVVDRPSTLTDWS